MDDREQPGAVASGVLGEAWGEVAAAGQAQVGLVDPWRDWLAAQPAEGEGVDVGHTSGVGNPVRFVPDGGRVRAGADVAHGFLADGVVSGHWVTSRIGPGRVR